MPERVKRTNADGPAKRPRVLYITINIPYFPGGGGTYIREYFLLKSLSRWIDFYVAAVIECPDPSRKERLLEFCQMAWSPDEDRHPESVKKPVGIKPAFYPDCLHDNWKFAAPHIESLNALIKSIKPDIIQIEHTQNAWLVERLDTAVAPTILTFHDIWTTRQLQYWSQATSLRKKLRVVRHSLESLRYERMYGRKASCLVAMSIPDARRMNRWFGHSNAVVIPSCIDVDHYASYHIGQPAKRHRLFYSGSMGWEPNVEAVFWFVKEVLPRISEKYPDAHLLIVGGDVPPELGESLKDNPAVQFAGFVPDVRQFIAESEVCIVPLKKGSGTRLKILEYMAMQKPIVSTRIGAEGIDVTDGQDILLADEPEAFARAVISLFKDPELACRIGLDARNLIMQRYDAERVASSAKELYFKLADVSDKIR